MTEGFGDLQYPGIGDLLGVAILGLKRGAGALVGVLGLAARVIVGLDLGSDGWNLGIKTGARGVTPIHDQGSNSPE